MESTSIVPEKEIARVRKEVYNNRRWHMQFLVEWLDFAVTHGCFSSGHTKEFYHFFCKIIHTIKPMYRDIVFEMVLHRVKEIIYTVPPGERIFTEQPYVSCIIAEVVVRERDIDLLFYEHGLAVLSQTTTPYPPFLTRYVATCVKALFMTYDLSDSDIEDAALSVMMESVYVKVLKKRSEKISAWLRYPIPFVSTFLTRECYATLATLLQQDVSALNSQECARFHKVADEYFARSLGKPYMQTTHVYDMMALIYKNQGINVVKQGALFIFLSEALEEGQRKEIQRQGGECLLELFRIYLQFCLDHKKTIKSHVFARWIMALCKKCS